MAVEKVDFVVGLIEVEPLVGETGERVAHVDGDATLDGFLIQLSRDAVAAREPLEASAAPCTPPSGNRFASQTQLPARLGSLAGELELAVAQVRRKMAAARQGLA